MVQIQKSTSSWRSSEDLSDMDLSQAAELLGSNLDLSDDMALIGMDNLFDDVENVITDDRDIFMGFTDDSHHLKNDIFMSCDTDQAELNYDLPPESVPYDDVTSPLHSSSDESQDQASYSGGLTPESDIMDSDIIEEEPVCNESCIPLVALEITGAISPLKDTKRPARRRTPTAKAGGVRKRRVPAKYKPAKTVRPRAGRTKQEPDIQCIKVCPPVNEKTTFSPSTMFPTIMSALKTHPANAVPLERLIKPKSVDPDISCIQTPPTTPVELKPATAIGAPFPGLLEAQMQHTEPEVTNTSQISNVTLSEQLNIQTQETSNELKDIEMEVVLPMSDKDSFPSAQSDSLQVDENQNETNAEETKNNNSPRTRGKTVRIPSPMRIRTRGITRRRPSFPAKVKTDTKSQKVTLYTPSPSPKVSHTQTVNKPVEQPLLSQETVVPPPTNCTFAQWSTAQSTTVTVQSVQCSVPSACLSEALFSPVHTRTLTVAPSIIPSTKTLPVDAKPASVTVVSSTARLGQPTVTSRPATQTDHLPRPAKITTIPLGTIPARSTILGVLPSSTRIRPAPMAAVVTQSTNIPIQHHPSSIRVQAVIGPTHVQAISAIPSGALSSTLPGVSAVKLQQHPRAPVPQLPAATTVSVFPQAVVSMKASTSPVQQFVQPAPAQSSPVVPVQPSLVVPVQPSLVVPVHPSPVVPVQPSLVVPVQPSLVVPVQPSPVVPVQPSPVVPVQPSLVVPVQPSPVVPVQPSLVVPVQLSPVVPVQPSPVVPVQPSPVVPVQPSPVVPAPPLPAAPQMPSIFIKKEVEDDTEDTTSVASRNSEILNILNKQTSSSCVKMEEDPLPRSYSGYSSSASSSGSPAPPQSPPYHHTQTPAVVSIKEEMLSDSDMDEDEYERFKNLPPEEQVRVRRRRYNNRVAAQRCRQRKRDYFQCLKKEIQEWECSNTELKYEIHVLQKELKNMAKVWTDHTTKCESAMALQNQKRKKHRKHRSETATSSSASAAASSTVVASDPSTAPVPIVVN